jgi:hypothetical protein
MSGSPLCCPTTGIEKILLSADGSDLSKGAVAGAISLAKACTGKLYVTFVIETNPEYEALAPKLVEKSEYEAKQYLEDVKAAALKEGVQCELIVHHGDEPYKLLVDDAAKMQADVIVMGRRGRTGLKRLMMGSVTAKVIGHSHCKVLVVPVAAKPEWKNVLAATDGSKQGNKAVMEAITIAKRCGSCLTIVSSIASDDLVELEDSSLFLKDIAGQVVESMEKNIRELKELAQKEGVNARGFVLSGNPAEAITATAKENNADLVVVGSHGRTGLDRLLMGSVTERVIVLSSCAVLVVKA